MLKKMMLLVFGVMTVCLGFAQKDTAYSYLRVYFNKTDAASRNYLKMEAEPGNKYAAEVYNLKTVKISEPAIEDPIYYVAPDKRLVDSLLFQKGNNAFKTVTEGLNFLAENNWQLYLVENNTSSSGSLGTVSNGIVTLPLIDTQPIYIFRKKI